MFRNQYDTDVTVWSPEGRLLQVITFFVPKRRGRSVVFGKMPATPPCVGHGAVSGRLSSSMMWYHLTLFLHPSCSCSLPLSFSLSLASHHRVSILLYCILLGRIRHGIRQARLGLCRVAQ